MATKKQNRRSQVRRARRILNRSWEVTHASGRKLNQAHWGAGLHRRDIMNAYQSEDD